MKTIGAVWREIQARLEAAHEVAPSEGKQLVKAALGCDDNDLILRENKVFPPGELAGLEAMVVRRMAGEPLAYILGFAWFYGRRWTVGPGVLIPRPDTEVLVEACLAKIDNHSSVLEIGVGSGCIGGTLLAERPGVTYVGVEIERRTAEVAIENIEAILAAERRRGGGERKFRQGPLPATSGAGETAEENCEIRVGDGYGPVTERFNLIVSNPPYVTDEEWENLESEVKDFEPRIALTGSEPNADGLVFYRRLIKGAPAHLHPGGWLCVEVGWRQAEAVRELLQECGQQEGGAWHGITILKDLGGRERVVLAQLH